MAEADGRRARSAFARWPWGWGSLLLVCRPRDRYGARGARPGVCDGSAVRRLRWRQPPVVRLPRAPARIGRVVSELRVLDQQRQRVDPEDVDPPAPTRTA